MSDLIRRSDAIEALGECPYNWTDTSAELQEVRDWEYHKACIEAVPSATDEEFEWCHDCKEYDQEKHCCHRWTKVIRNTVAEFKADRPKGEWKPFDLTWGRSIWYCTACEESVEVPCDIWTHKPIYNFCPNCGADMRGEDNENK